MQCRPIASGTGLQQCLATLRAPRIGSCWPLGSAHQEPDHPHSLRMSSPASSGRGLMRRHLLFTIWGLTGVAAVTQIANAPMAPADRAGMDRAGGAVLQLRWRVLWLVSAASRLDPIEALRYV